jgi:hypothetical protein
LRPVPRLIDNHSRMGEYLMVFMVPLFLLRTIDPVFGLLVGLFASVAYMRLTVGKPDGYLVHRLYRAGLPLSGLLERRIRRLVP